MSELVSTRFRDNVICNYQRFLKSDIDMPIVAMREMTTVIQFSDLNTMQNARNAGNAIR